MYLKANTESLSNEYIFYIYTEEAETTKFYNTMHVILSVHFLECRGKFTDKEESL